MAISYGNDDNHLRVGIDTDVVSSSNTSVTVKFKFYADPVPNGWGWNDDMAMRITGDAGTSTVNFHKSAANDQLVATRTLTISRYSTTSRTVHVGCHISGAFNGANPSQGLDFTIAAKPTDPPKPPLLGSIVHYNVTQTGASIKWGVSADDGGSTAYESQLQIASSPGFPGENIVYDTTGSSRDRTTGVLTANTTYYYRIRFRNYAEGFGDWSANRSFTTDPRVPFIVTRNSPASITQSGATLSWSPNNDGGRPILDYLLRYRKVPAGEWIEETVDGTSKVLTGLQSGTTHEWRVRARNSVGLSAFQDPGLDFTTLVAVVGAPSLPTVNPIGTTTATVSWNTPPDGGSLISGYQVQYSTSSSFTSPTTVSPGLVNSVQLTGLSTTTTYYTRVRGLSGAGNGDWSPSKSFTTGAVVVPYPVIKFWNGADWVRLNPALIWNGTEFTEVSDVRYWNGSSFVSILDEPY